MRTIVYAVPIFLFILLFTAPTLGSSNDKCSNINLDFLENPSCFIFLKYKKMLQQIDEQVKKNAEICTNKDLLNKINLQRELLNFEEITAESNPIKKKFLYKKIRILQDITDILSMKKPSLPDEKKIIYSSITMRNQKHYLPR